MWQLCSYAYYCSSQMYTQEICMLPCARGKHLTCIFGWHTNYDILALNNIEHNIIIIIEEIRLKLMIGNQPWKTHSQICAFAKIFLLHTIFYQFLPISHLFHIQQDTYLILKARALQMNS